MIDTACWPIYFLSVLCPVMSLEQSLHEGSYSAYGLNASSEYDEDVPSSSTGTSAQNNDEKARAEPEVETGPNKSAPKKGSTVRESLCRQDSRFFAGGKLGAIVATFGGPDADGEFIESTYSAGFAVNAFARYVLREHWSIQSELAYTTRGSDSTVEGEDRPPFDLSYLELTFAIQTQWTLSQINKHIQAYAYLGPAVGYLLSAEREGRELTGFKSVDYGLYGGAGLNFALPFGTPLFDIRYYYGIPDIDETQRNISHRAFSVFLGYEVPLPF
ncbi:MAG: PorT family protein [Proteobacteria bacterium]|nr:PorT family protein [Pseudomonadota bacterium]